MGKTKRTREELDAWKGATTIKLSANRCSVCRKVRPRREVDIRFQTRLVVCSKCEEIERALVACHHRAQLIREWIGTDDNTKAVGVMIDLGAHLDAVHARFLAINRKDFVGIRACVREQLSTRAMGDRVAAYTERVLYEAIQQFPNFNAGAANDLAVSFLDEKYGQVSILDRLEDNA